jgi:hypothetical protein
MPYRDDLEAARLRAERLHAENTSLRDRLRSRARRSSRLGASIAMLSWTLAALALGFAGVLAPDEPDAPSAADITTVGDVLTPAQAAMDWGDVRARPAN